MPLLMLGLNQGKWLAATPHKSGIFPISTITLDFSIPRLWSWGLDLNLFLLQQGDSALGSARHSLPLHSPLRSAPLRRPTPRL
jgi:hypothetical protein